MNKTAIRSGFESLKKEYFGNEDISQAEELVIYLWFLWGCKFAIGLTRDIANGSNSEEEAIEMITFLENQLDNEVEVIDKSDGRN